MVLCGFGRVGSATGTALSTFGVPYLVVEVDPDLAATLRARGIPTLFGDAAHRDILQRAGVEKASIIIVTIPDPDRARLAVINARRLNPNAPILARAHRATYHEVLARAGATEIIQPELEASSTLIRHAFSYLKVPDKQIRAYLRGFRQAMVTLQEKNSETSLSFAEVREASLANPDLVGRSVRNSEIWERFHVAVVSVTRPGGEKLLNPDPGMILKRGDKLRVLGFPDEIDTFVLHASQDSEPQD
jgi:voltage-gated potassium channel Kch